MQSEDDVELVGKVRKRDRLMPMPVTVTGCSCISVFWISCTFLLLSGLIVAGGFPNWIRNRVEPGTQATNLRNALSSVDLGLYYMCYNLTGCTQSRCSGYCEEQKLCGCYTYLTYDPPVTINRTNGGVVIPTNLKPIDEFREIVFLFSSSIVYAFGVLMLLLSLLVGALALWKPRMGSCSLFLFAFVMQVTAGVALIVALALLPVFFGSEQADMFCGVEANYYQRGQCSIDWALFLSMVATSCSLYLPALAIFAMNVSDGLNAQICC